MAWTDGVLTTLYWISRPIVWLLYAIVSIAYWAASPFIGLARATFNFMMLPVHVVVQFEALWKFLGTAVLVGLVFGGSLFLVSSAIFNFLGLGASEKSASSATVEEAPPSSTKGHTAASYRAARQRKKMQEQLQQASRSRWTAAKPLLAMNMPLTSHQHPSTSSALNRPATWPRPDLLSTAILEEMSSTSST